MVRREVKKESKKRKSYRWVGGPVSLINGIRKAKRMGDHRPPIIPNILTPLGLARHEEFLNLAKAPNVPRKSQTRPPYNRGRGSRSKAKLALPKAKLALRKAKVRARRFISPLNTKVISRKAKVIRACERRVAGHILWRKPENLSPLKRIMKGNKVSLYSPTLSQKISNVDRHISKQKRVPLSFGGSKESPKRQRNLDLNQIIGLLPNGIQLKIKKSIIRFSYGTRTATSAR